MILDDTCRWLLMGNSPLVDKPIVVQYTIYTSPVVVLNDKRPTFQFSREPPNDLDTKLHCMIITTNLYMLSTIQLCMCFMERQESKIHRVTMIKCSTMLLAGLFYSVIILSNCWLWSVHCLQYILLNQRLTLESWDIITKNKHIPTDS